MSTISIIGAGTMATAIAGRITGAGHVVEIINRDPANARALADRLATGATTGAYGAAPAGDIVILAVPYSGAAAVVTDFGDALNGKVIIDIANPVAHDLSRLVTPHGSSGAQETAKGLPVGAHVVKAFNTIFGHVLAKRGPLDVGGLHMAQTLEALGLMMIGLAKNGVDTWNFAMYVDVG